MIALDDPAWNELYSAGNDANILLGNLLEGKHDFEEDMEILAEDLSHQLSFYTMTAYVLPHLADFCSKLSLDKQVFLIAQMGAAIAAEASDSLPSNTREYQEFQEGLSGLRQVTERLVTDPRAIALLREDAELGQEFALSALSILGDRGHAYTLYLLSAYCWQNGHAACDCGWNDEEFPLDEQPDCIEPACIGSWDGNSLENEAIWFQGLLRLADDKEITPVLPLIYGTGICPECSKREPYWNWMDRSMNEY